MVRWVEQAFRGVSPRDLKGIRPSNCTEVYGESYTVSRYWQDLAFRQQAADIVISSDDIELRYSDSRPVFKDPIFKNGAVVKDIFNALNTASVEVSKKTGLPTYKWPEKIQRSADFNVEICEAAEKAWGIASAIPTRNRSHSTRPLTDVPALAGLATYQPKLRDQGWGEFPVNWTTSGHDATSVCVRAKRCSLPF